MGSFLSVERALRRDLETPAAVVQGKPGQEATGV
jgi:hypothetical protein